MATAQQSGVDLVSRLTEPRNIAIGVTVVGAGALVAARHAGVNSIPDLNMSTEQALTAYTSVAGIGGFLANLIASNQLTKLDRETVSVAEIGVPIGIAIGGSVVAASLFPSE